MSTLLYRSTPLAAKVLIPPSKQRPVSQMCSSRRCSPTPWPSAKDLICHKRTSHLSLRKFKKSACLECHSYLTMQSKCELLRLWKHQNRRRLYFQICPDLPRRWYIKEWMLWFAPPYRCILSLNQRGLGLSHIMTSISMCMSRHPCSLVFLCYPSLLPLYAYVETAISFELATLS